MNSTTREKSVLPKSKYVVVTPEQRELERKGAELAGLECELAERERELATLQNELRSFEGRYFHTVGSLDAELDDLEAQLAEAEARQHPQERSYRERATQARAKAADSAQPVAHETVDVGLDVPPLDRWWLLDSGIFPSVWSQRPNAFSPRNQQLHVTGFTPRSRRCTTKCWRSARVRTSASGRCRGGAVACERTNAFHAVR